MSAPEKIAALLESGQATIPVDKLASLGAAVANHMQASLAPRATGRGNVRLYASEIGEKCGRKLWFKQHNQTVNPVEPLPYHTKFKFLYGNVIEELALTLAEQAGCEVTHRQERVESTHVVDDELIDISGRIDAIIDGSVVDVKSSSSQAMKKYESGSLQASDDTFGYREQLFYYYYYRFRETTTGTPWFLMIDKTLGHIKQVTPEWMTKEELDAKIAVATRAVKRPVPMDIQEAFKPVPEGKSGNMKLCMPCSYCQFKKECFNYEAYAYASGPMFLTDVVVTPKVPKLEALSHEIPF
jgi:hypothetical protein